MCKQKVYALLLVLVVGILLSGCSKVGNNPKFARRVLTCVYDGSLRPLYKHMTTDLENVLTDKDVAIIGKSLREKYGKPEQILVGKNITNNGKNTTTYVIQARKGSYRMILTIDERNMIAGLYFPEAEE